MPTSPAISKISRPRLTKAYARSRLYKRLDQARKKPVTWVAAPAGAGKTTVVGSYLDTRKLPCLWYQLDAGDGDVATFFHYLGLAARKAAPRKRKALPHLTPEYLLGLPTFTRRFFQELYGRLNVPALLVFDNYQDVPRDSPLHQVMREAFSVIPDEIQIIVISRGEPPAAFARIRANNTMTIIGWDELRLTEDETKGIARLRNQVGNRKHKQETIQQLHKQAQGWAAGVVLILETADLETLPQQILNEPTQEIIFDYFAGEIFQHAEPETQDFLLKTALLPNMTVSLAEALTGLPKANKLLSELNHKHYFTDRLAQKEAVYQYHPLFREFLLARGKKTFSPVTLAQLQRDAAKALEAAGDIEHAAHMLLAAEDWDSLSRLIKKHASVLLEEGRNETIASWLSKLPKTWLEKEPWLLYWLGVSRLPAGPSEARAHLDKAFELFKKIGELQGLFMCWYAVIDTFAYEWGNFKPLDHWIAEIEKLLIDHQEFPPEEIETRVSCGMFIALMNRQPNHPLLPQWEERVWDIVINDPDLQTRIGIGSHLIIYYTWWIGDLAKAEILLNTLRPLIRTPGISPLNRITWCTMTAAFYWMTAANQDCIKIVNEGLETARATGIHLWDMLLCSQGVFAALSSGDTNAATTYLKTMATLLPAGRPLDNAMYYYLSAWKDLNQGNLPQARENAQLAVAMSEESGALFSAATMRNDLGRVAFYQGEHRLAWALITQSRQEGRGMRANTIEYLTWLSEAEFSLALGNEQACLKALRNFLAVGKRQNFQNHTWWRSSMMVHLYIKALEHNIEVGYVQKLIRNRSLVPDDPPLHLENWPWAIKVYTLGRFAVVTDSNPVQFTGKSQRKPLELLKVLIALGGREVSETRLTDAMWPDAEGDTARRTFDTTLHRLRKILGNKPVLKLSDGCLTLDTRYCWVDSWALERNIGRLETLLRVQHVKTIGEEFPVLFDKTMALYQSPFLRDEVDSTWALGRREQLHSRLLALVTACGRYWEQKNQWDRAAGCYRKGLEIDELVEEFYCHLMQVYRQLGRQVEALAVYRRCEKTLSGMLGVPPSKETQALYQELHS